MFQNFTTIFLSRFYDAGRKTNVFVSSQQRVQHLLDPLRLVHTHFERRARRIPRLGFPRTEINYGGTTVDLYRYDLQVDCWLSVRRVSQLTHARGSRIYTFLA